MIGNEAAQAQYKLLDEETRSMEKCLQALKVLVEATFQAQADGTNLATMFRLVQHVLIELKSFQDEPALTPVLACIRASVASRQRSGCLVSMAGEAANLLDPRFRPSEPTPESEIMVLKMGVEHLLQAKFGDTTDWKDDRRQEMKSSIGVRLKGQLNKYLLKLAPFVEDACPDVKVFWESKLREAEELARVALFVHAVGVSEAAVERSFSTMKFVNAPLRCKMASSLVQAIMFVRFNFPAYGEERFIPEEVKVYKRSFQYHYTDLPCDDEDFAEPEDTPETTPEAFLLFGGAADEDVDSCED